MKLSYGEQIQREIAKSQTQRNAARLFYYKEALKMSAVVGWETFKGSWAYRQWIQKNDAAIQAFVAEQNRRFGYMGRWA